MHIVDKIHYESMILNSLNKQFKENPSKVTLEKLEISIQKLRNLLQEYGKILEDQAKIFGDLTDILSPDEKKFFEIDGMKKRRSKKRKGKSKKKSKRRRSKKRSY